MKKKIFIVLTVLLIITSLAVCFTACNKGGKSVDKKDNISRMTEKYLAGEDENFAVLVESGRREKQFIADGKATDVKPFSEITVIPLLKNEFTEINFELASPGNTLAGSVQPKNPGEFSVEISLGFAPETVKLTAGDITSEIVLSNILENAKNGNEIVEIAKKEFADRIAKEGGASNREIYVKLITGDRENYYFYVSFIGKGTDYWALLADPFTGEVITKR